MFIKLNSIKLYFFKSFAFNQYNDNIISPTRMGAHSEWVYAYLLCTEYTFESHTANILLVVAPFVNYCEVLLNDSIWNKRK